MCEENTRTALSILPSQLLPFGSIRKGGIPYRHPALPPTLSSAVLGNAISNQPPPNEEASQGLYPSLISGYFYRIQWAVLEYRGDFIPAKISRPYSPWALDSLRPLALFHYRSSEINHFVSGQGKNKKYYNRTRKIHICLVIFTIR